MAQQDNSSTMQMNAEQPADAGMATEKDGFKQANAEMMSEMGGVPMTGNADVDFASLMIPHHRGAAAMAKVELSFGKDQQIRKVAEDIIAKQGEEISFLQNWLQANAGASSKDAKAGEAEAFKAANAGMMSEMDAIPLSGNADVDLARLMIPHHRGAAAMAKVELEYGKDPVIRKVAEEIIAMQGEEISFLETWLKANSQ